MRIPRSYRKLAEVGAIILLCASTAYAAYDYFLKIKLIAGESTDTAHPGWIEVTSFSWGASRMAGANLPAIQSFTFTKKLDTASSFLYTACLRGDPISSLTLGLNRTIVGAAGTTKPEILKYVFTNVLVSSFKVAGTTLPTNTEPPLEEVSFNFQKIEWTYTPIDPKTFQTLPSIKGGWDAVQNQPRSSADSVLLKME